MTINVDTIRLRRIATTCEQQADHYDNQRRAISQRCESLQNTWTGISAHKFQNISSQWIQSTQHTATELRTIARTLRNIADHYEQLQYEERKRNNT